MAVTSVATQPVDTMHEWLSAEWVEGGTAKQVNVTTLEKCERAAIGIRGVAEAAIIASSAGRPPAPRVVESMWQAVMSMASSIECEMEAARMRTPGAQA